MNVGSLFAGIGGFDLGLERAGFQVAWQVEIDPFCRAVLAKHWPHVARYNDVHFTSSALVEPVDLLCGGFPCQDLSIAGQQAGIDRGHRSGLWREFARLVGEFRPAFVVVENVAHTWRKWVPRVRSDLGSRGYASLPLHLRASDFGAPHERARCFVVAAAHAHSAVLRDESRWCLGPRGTARASVALDARSARDAADADGEGQLQPEGSEPGERGWPRDCGGWASEPDVARVVHGLPGRVDGRARRAREHALGNAIIPQAAEWIGRRLMEAQS